MNNLENILKKYFNQWCYQIQTLFNLELILSHHVFPKKK